MEWIERISRVGTQLVPIVLDGEGNRSERRLSDLRSTLRHLVKTNGIEVVGVSLRSLERVDASEYLQALGLPDANPHTHEVFLLKDGDRRFLIPAAVLLTGLISRIANVGDLLLSAASLDQVATPVVVDDGLRIVYHPPSALSRRIHEPSVASRFLWLTCHASARAFWASVYAKACEGVLGLEPPCATVSCQIYTWKRQKGTYYVSGISIHSIEPLEPALPFAAPYAPTCFKFDAKRFSSSANLRAARSDSRGTRLCDIPPGRTGLEMTVVEWVEVLARMQALGCRCEYASLSSINAALTKRATGVTWEALGSNYRTARSAYSSWKRSGKWDALLSVLRELRASGCT